jgi:hypothetical protein
MPLDWLRTPVPDIAATLGRSIFGVDCVPRILFTCVWVSGRVVAALLGPGAPGTSAAMFTAMLGSILDAREVYF